MVARPGRRRIVDVRSRSGAKARSQRYIRMPAELNMRGNEARLRREVGLFRERFQALSAMLQDLQSPRAPQSVLRSAEAVIANTMGADSVWIVDGRTPSPRPLLRGSEAIPGAALKEVRHCMRTARHLSVAIGETIILLVPLQAGSAQWGVLAVRIPEPRTPDPEALRFLSLAASLIGGSAALWESRAPKGYEIDAVFQGWLSLSGLPSRCLLLTGETGTGKRTLAERLHERYVGGGFSTLSLDGSEEDDDVVDAQVRRPGTRSVYVHDVVRASPAARTALYRTMQTENNIVFFLGTSESVAPVFPDLLLSRASLVTIRMPALRERAGEVPGLVQMGLGERGVKVKLSSSAKTLLAAHAWPGNYGELARFIAHAEQALRLDGGATLTGGLTRHLLGEHPWLSLEQIVDGLEAHVLSEALRRCDGNRAAAGRVIGMTPRQVSYKCKKYGLE